MNRLGKLFVAAAIAVVPAACKKDEVQKNADKAAETLQDKREDLTDQTKDVKKAVEDSRENAKDYANSDTDLTRKMNEDQLKHNANEIRDESKDVQEKAAGVQTAEYEFDMRRRERVGALRAQHGVIASQVQLINTMATVTPLTDKARSDLSEKMQTFTTKLNESGNSIEALQVTDEQNFKDRDSDAEKAMDSLKDSRKDAWDALNDGDRVESS
jgi:hypothetical protein